jgi:hypothetical protein
MKKNWSDTLWNEEIRRCGMIGIAEKMMEARVRWYGHVIRRDEEELVRHITDILQKRGRWRPCIKEDPNN